jgi:NAD(P)-dependent dehydrogenase (short-subunit alcohol dehydrogenase family)
MGEYAGRTVVVTGAGSGLGAAMADLFAGEGAKVALLDIDAGRAEARAEELRERGTDAFAMCVDVADKANVEAAAQAVSERFGSCEVLCANVGVQQFGAVDSLSDQDWDWVMSVNFRGVVNTVGAFLPLIRAGGGKRHILLTASASFFQLGARMAAYVASKYAVVGYGEVLRQELAQEGINVAMLFPAGMMTRHIESSIAARPSELGSSRFDQADVRAMVASSDVDTSADLATAEEAVRNLLAELETGEPYIITHGSYRRQVEARHRRVTDAFRRMEEARE